MVGLATAFSADALASGTGKHAPSHFQTKQAPCVQRVTEEKNLFKNHLPIRSTNPTSLGQVKNLRHTSDHHVRCLIFRHWWHCSTYVLRRKRWGFFCYIHKLLWAKFHVLVGNMQRWWWCVIFLLKAGMLAMFYFLALGFKQKYPCSRSLSITCHTREQNVIFAITLLVVLI